MYKTLSFYWFIILFSYVCNLKNVFTEESIPVRLNFKGKYTSDINNYEIVVPQRVNEDGTFISHLVSHRHSKRSTKDLEFIFYKIPIAGKDYLIELTPNRKLISPGAVIEIHNGNVWKSDNRQFSNESISNENLGKMFKDLHIRKLENTDCHFSGTVKGENISKAALSTCYGLAGFIQIKEGLYTIEPIAEHDPFLEDAYPHILYRADGLENSSVCQAMGEITASLIRKRRENIASPVPKYVETLIVMDKALIDHHGDSDCENYVLTVFNMAFNLFHDASSGLIMVLNIVRMIRLEVENDEINLEINKDAEKTLRSFQNWQYEINPGDDSHPNHHDIALLLTRVNVCYSPSSCGLLGLTTIGKACDPKLSAAVCEDNGLRLGYIIAHEIGHLLGADHDTGNSSCNGTDSKGLKTVMHPHVSLSSQTWSTCSQAYFKQFFRSGLGNCLLDEPEEHHFNVQDLLPGVMYNADYQCKHLITTKARECEMGSTCNSLNCFVPGYACVVTHNPPADGTRCGENMWCHHNKCIIVGERPGAVDGNWGEWSPWSDCSRTCGSGVANSERNCDKPQPSHGGKHCIGERRRYKICAATEVNVSFVGKPCETGRPSFRDIQCGEFNDWIYPEDGKVHTWVAYFFHDDNPCTLYCINEAKEVAALRPRVVDGTMCFRGIRDICVGGICKSLPCDLHFESNAIEDACGICHGDGTGCEFSEGTETFSQLKKGLTKLVNIPSGTRNIRVEELSPTLAKIIVKDKDTKEIYVKGKSIGMFSVPGSQAWLGIIRKNQEALNIPGPVTKPLSIWIQRLDNVSVKWSMALPVEQQRKPEFAWDFLRWSPCSAKCGPGTQVSKPSCMEGKAGLVEDSFCAELEAPPAKVRQCEVTECKARWMVGDWKGCNKHTTQKKERKRIVYCIKPIGEGEGESQIVPDSECLDPKPHEIEPCENRRKREDNEYNTAPFSSSDTAEFGFHNKYDDYLKHFAALSVPQRNSETIPFHLVSSPHFKHYFHVLEDSDLTSEMDVNTPDGNSYENVAPSFYKETFSGEQIGVTHIKPEQNIYNRTKKSVEHRRNLESQNKKLVSNRFKKYSNIGNAKRSWKTFNYTSPNLLNVVENLKEEDKVKFVKLLNNERPEETSPLDRATIRNLHWNPKKLPHKWNNFFSLFRKKAKQNEKHNHIVSPRIIKQHYKDYDGSGLRKLHEKVQGGGAEWKKVDKVSCGNPFDPTSTGRFNHRFRDKGAFEDWPRRNKRHETKKKESKGATSNRKKLSIIWKEPKSGKEQSGTVGGTMGGTVGGTMGGTVGGTESENYLNNLFRNSHPKNINPKPTPMNEAKKVKQMLKKPVIREGVVVVDKDSPEDQEMEVVSEWDEAEDIGQEFSQLPRPRGKEKVLKIKGKDVFNVLQKLQEMQKRSGRGAFYRSKNRQAEKLEINIKADDSKPSNQANETTTATTKTTTATTETTSATTKTTKSTEATHTTEASTTTTKRTQVTTEKVKHEDEMGTSSPDNKTTKKSPEGNTTKISEDTDEKTNDQTDYCDYDMDEVITEAPKSTTEISKADKKNIKKAEKKKKKEEKKKKKEEKKKEKVEEKKEKEEAKKKRKKKHKKKKKKGKKTQFVETGNSEDFPIGEEKLTKEITLWYSHEGL